VDDASERSVRSVIDGFRDARIRLLRHETWQGASTARNTGIRDSSGRYVAFLDDDDEWFPEKIELQLKDLREKGSKYRVSYCQRELYDDEKDKLIGTSEIHRDGDHLPYMLAREIVPSTSCVLVERECLERVGPFRKDLPAFEDLELWIRLSEYYDFAALNRVLVRYHIHKGGRISDSTTGKLTSNSIIYEVHRGLFLKHRKARSLFLLKFGYESQEVGNDRKSRLLFLMSIGSYPFRLEPHLALGLLMIRSVRRRVKRSEVQPNGDAI
jgi:glycosyltransferase involved in cell wall biosynthesis